MTVLISIFILLAILQFSVLIGPPYVPTLRRQRLAALKLLNLKAGQTFYDLGCGDGSLLKEAAGQGLQVVGYEINPLLAAVAWLRTRSCRKQVKIKVGNFWKSDLSDADGIYVFLAGKYMKKLDRLIKARTNPKPLQLISYGFKIPGKEAAVEKDGLFLYRYN